MTKTIRDNFTGLEADEDESWEFQFVDRNDHRGLIKVEGDITKSGFLELYGKMVKKPKYQIWIKAVKDSTGKQITGGYWQKLEEDGHK